MTRCVNSANTNWPLNGSPTGEIGSRSNAEVMLRGADAMFRGGLVHECRSIHESFANASADSVGARHGLWLAAEDVAAGFTDCARQRLLRVVHRDLPVDEQAVYAFVQAALAVDGGETGSDHRDYRAARNLMEVSLKPHADVLRLNLRLRSYYRRFLQRLAAERGDMIARIVSWVRMLVVRS